MLRVFPLFMSLFFVISCNITSCSTSKKASSKIKISEMSNPCIDCGSVNSQSEKEYLSKMKKKFSESKNEFVKDHILRDLYLKGTTYEGNYEFDKSEQFFQLLTKLTPKDPHLLNKYIMSLVRNGSVEKALVILEDMNLEALDQEESTQLQQLKASVYESLGNFEGAAHVYDKVLVDHPGDIDVCIKRSYLERENSTTKAIKILKNCHDKNKKNEYKSELSFKTGRLYLDLGELKKAEQYFKQAYQEYPENSKSLAAIGVILGETKRIEVTLSLFKNHLKKYPDDYLISKRLMDHYVEREKYESALPYMEKMVDLNPKDPAVKYKLAYLYREVASYDKAIDSLKEVIPFGVETDKAYFFMGDLYIKKNQFKEAVLAFKEIKFDSTYYKESKMREMNLLRDIALVPSRSIAAGQTKDVKNYFTSLNAIKKEAKGELDFEVGVNKSLFWKKKNNFKNAAKALEEIKNHENFNSDHHFFLASMYEKDKLFDKADKIVLEMIKANPDNAQAYNYIGYSLIERVPSDLKRAKIYLEKALSLKPKDAHILDSIGWLYFKMGNYKSALDHLHKSFDNGLENDFTVNKHLGMSYKKMGDTQKAKHYFDQSLMHATSDQERETIFKLIGPDPKKMPASI